MEIQTFADLIEAEKLAEAVAKKDKATNDKRLTKYPHNVRRIKRLRKQIDGLMRCIESLKDINEYVLMLISNKKDVNVVGCPQCGAIYRRTMEKYALTANEGLAIYAAGIVGGLIMGYLAFHH